MVAKTFCLLRRLFNTILYELTPTFLTIKFIFVTEGKENSSRMAAKLKHMAPALYGGKIQSEEKLASARSA